jgi:2-oxoglutarate dehydrogenase E2 component (dihydrolipoamide succinyltransferase)
MAIDILVPQLGESIVEATVGEWLKQKGEAVAIGDPLVSLETDKVDVEVGAEVVGILVSIKCEQGEDVKVGDVLGAVESDGQDLTSEMSRRDAVRGTERNEESLMESQVEQAAEVERESKDAQRAAIGRATPVAKRLADDEGIDLAKVSGSGHDGKVTKQDVEAYLGQRAVEAPRSQEDEKTSPAVYSEGPILMVRDAPEAVAGSTTALRREERILMSRRRRTIARRLVEVQQSAAMLTTFNEIDTGAMMELRQRRQETFVDRHGVKLGITSFFVKAALSSLRAFPRLNAEIDGKEIVIKHYYDIGIAVGDEEGLVVPVIRNADGKTFAEIEQEVKTLVQKAVNGALSLDDLRGGTFTITNGGVFGSMMSTPILNPPQVGILGLHAIEERPVARDGEVVIRPMMYVALTYDHRIVDGREAVQFLVRIKELIEEPEMLLLEG